jgi:DNA polymerase I
MMAGLAPADATKQSHKAIRNVCKTVVLGTNYGMGAESLAYRTGLSKIEAQEILRKLAITFPTFTAWAQHVIDVAMLSGSLSTVFGWTVHVTGTSRPTSLRNYPMQANGAEMLRLACSIATERGIEVCAPVHDALLVEGPTGEIEDVVLATRAAMTEASRAVLDGLEIGTDAEIVRWPDRYADSRGAVMWDRVMDLV